MIQDPGRDMLLPCRPAWAYQFPTNGVQLAAESISQDMWDSLRRGAGYYSDGSDRRSDRERTKVVALISAGRKLGKEKPSVSLGSRIATIELVYLSRDRRVQATVKRTKAVHRRNRAISRMVLSQLGWPDDYEMICTCEDAARVRLSSKSKYLKIQKNSREFKNLEKGRLRVGQ